MAEYGTHTIGDQAFCSACNSRVCEHVHTMISAMMTHPCAPPERSILTDLIAELRSTCNLWQASGKNGVVHRVMPISEVIRLADRAEARLREVQGE